MKLYISEYETTPAKALCGQQPALTRQTLTFDDESIQSQPFHARARFVRIHTDAICALDFGQDPVADANGLRMAADATEFFGVNAGDKVAVMATR